jgi:nucleotide-binding universal stress UspA family protein
MFRKILVALDHAASSPALFDESLALAQALKADLMLLHVLSDEDADSPQLPLYGTTNGYPIFFEESLWETYNDDWNAYEQRGLEQLQRYAETARQAGVRAEFMQNVGNPGKNICEVAKSWNADLILVGNRGRTGLSEILLGSVSNYVMHHAPCSVLVFHTGRRAKVEPLRETAVA